MAVLILKVREVGDGAVTVTKKSISLFVSTASTPLKVLHILRLVVLKGPWPAVVY